MNDFLFGPWIESHARFVVVCIQSFASTLARGSVDQIVFLMLLRGAHVDPVTRFMRILEPRTPPAVS
ncbi:hypothetical protein [Burkholderia sp. BCC1993]|uniref:hypothetical protein n=1 Tax=Burkholderia sp. BCC1993 TaxID=2817444 RepID=UPI002AB226D9|nr:hypothetical protein [Burkholderia sp. BCC1993]